MTPGHGILKRSKTIAKRSKRELVSKTLEEDYPGLDYLGLHSVLVAKKRWYCIGWFTLLFICVFGGLFTVVKVIQEYNVHPALTKVEVKSMESLPLPYVTVCPTRATTLDLDKIYEFLLQNYSKTITRRDALDLANFMVGGSGFQKIDPDGFQNRNQTDQLYLILKGAQGIQEFFHNDLFHSCTLRSHPIECCEYFSPTYTIRRGRCFRLKEQLVQTTFDEQGKLTIRLNNHIDYAREEDGQNLLAFIGDEKPEIAPFPRFYLYENTSMRLQIKATHMNLVEEGDSVCTEAYSSLGKSTCYLNNWLQFYLEDVYNCTYPYMDLLRRTGLGSCNPTTVMDNYMATVQNVHYHKHQCILPCNRWEYTAAMERVSVRNAVSPFRIDIFYNDLQYEEFSGVYTTTLMGLLAQIGGQLSLFLGSSILSLVQLSILLVVIGNRVVKHRKMNVNIPAPRPEPPHIDTSV